VITNDAVVSIGLYLIGLGLTLGYVGDMWLTAALGGTSAYIDLLLFLFLMIPGTLVFWTMLHVVRSSQKAIFVCFVQVIHHVGAAPWCPAEIVP